MVQILPANPGFGERLGLALGRGLGSGASKAFEDRQLKQFRDKAQDPNATLQERIAAASRLPATEQKAYLTGLALEAKQSQDNPQISQIKQKYGIGGIQPQQVDQQAQMQPTMTENIQPPFVNAYQAPTYQNIQPEQSLQETGGFGINKLYPQEDIIALASSKNAQDRAISDRMQKANQDVVAREKIQIQKDKLLKSEESENKNILLDFQKQDEESLKRASDTLFALENQLDAVNSGEVGPGSWANLSEALMESGYKRLGQLFQSQGGAAFKTGGKQIFAGAKNIFGAKVSNFEADIYDAMQAGVGRNKEANRVAIFSLMAPVMVDKEKARYRMQLIEEDPTINPVKLNSLVSKHSREYSEKLFDQLQNYIKDYRATKSKKKYGKRKSLMEIFG